jgi:hypothetical protein
MYFQGDLRKSFVLISGAGGFGIREDREHRLWAQTGLAQGLSCITSLLGGFRQMPCFLSVSIPLSAKWGNSFLPCAWLLWGNGIQHNSPAQGLVHGSCLLNGGLWLIYALSNGNFQASQWVHVMLWFAQKILWSTIVRDSLQNCIWFSLIRYKWLKMWE